MKKGRHSFTVSRFFHSEYFCNFPGRYLISITCKLLQGICGRPVFPPRLPKKDEAGNRISNGAEAAMYSYPWQALVITRGPDAYRRCGGSFIHWREKNASSFVLTAAHCVLGNLPHLRGERLQLAKLEDLRVVLGAHDIDITSPEEQQLSVVKLAVAEYNETSFDQDIALLMLEKEVTYNDYIQGICLPHENEEPPGPESICVVTGWGQLAYCLFELLADGQYGEKLQELQVGVVGGQVNSPLFQEKSMVCTGHDEIDTGARKGDSGGPLACLKDGTFTLYGVLSFAFAEKCPLLKERQAFSKVSYYLPWIMKTISKFS
ncbi:newborn larvae specific serine protease ss2 [Trichuris trichiura]|uniref:Newborn larvae specific serine protease ss2 n=1 Tax=Trichuris trichiura TaxID=36087 RepID=A0A077Z7U4_TRITR|nr:newborn larvae specific serine protease ss2 [Trichuris trichiura]